MINCRREQKLRARLGPQADRTLEAYRRYKTLMDKKKKLIKSTLRQTHRDLVAEAAGDMERVWKLAKWAKNRASPFVAFTPALKRPDGSLADTHSEKARLLTSKFFPPPPEADLSDIRIDQDGWDYPDPVDFPTITADEIEGTVRDTAPNKAPGPDDIPNRALVLGLPVILPALIIFFNLCLGMGHRPQCFKAATTVGLRKPGKGDSSEVGAYRPIALLPTIGKALEAIIAKRIS